MFFYGKIKMKEGIEMKELFERLFTKLVKRTEETERAIMTMLGIDPKKYIDQELLTELLIKCGEGKHFAKEAKEKMKLLLEQNEIEVEEELLKLCKKNIEQAISLEMRENELIKIVEKLIQQPQVH